MLNESTGTRSRTARWGWGILLAVAGLLVVNGLALYFVIVNTPTEQTIAILLTGFGALTLTVALEGFRHGSRWAWNAMWVVVGVLAVIGLHMLSVGARVDVGAWYLVLAVVMLAGQLLAGRQREAAPRSAAGRAVST